MATYTGGCHCGRIRYQVEGELTGVSACSCSICSKTGYRHWTVEHQQLRLLTLPGDWVTYRFLTGKAENRFCPTCGISPFRVPRSDPDKITVNVRCLDGVDADALPITRFDGRHWEVAMRDERGPGWKEG
jgi:hypothetical protein